MSNAISFLFYNLWRLRSGENSSFPRRSRLFPVERNWGFVFSLSVDLVTGCVRLNLLLEREIGAGDGLGFTLARTLEWLWLRLADSILMTFLLSYYSLTINSLCFSRYILYSFSNSFSEVTYCAMWFIKSSFDTRFS